MSTGRMGALLKKKGHPIGQTLGHTFGDTPAWTYPLLWAFGGAETDPTGKKVVLNSKRTIESVRWMTAFWKAPFPVTLISAAWKARLLDAW